MYFEDLNEEPETEKGIAGYVVSGKLQGRIYPIFKESEHLHAHIALVISPTSLVYLSRNDVIVDDEDVLEVLYG